MGGSKKLEMRSFKFVKLGLTSYLVKLFLRHAKVEKVKVT